MVEVAIYRKNSGDFGLSTISTPPKMSEINPKGADIITYTNLHEDELKTIIDETNYKVKISLLMQYIKV